MGDSDMGRTILVVDDNPTILQLLDVLLGTQFHVVTALSGDDALRAVADPATPPVDAAVVDVMMPEMDGFTLVGHLRAAVRADLPIVMLTAMDDAEHKQQAHALAVAAYITKPFEPELLLATLDLIVPTPSAVPVAPSPDRVGRALAVQLDRRLPRSWLVWDMEVLEDIVVVHLEHVDDDGEATGRVLAGIAVALTSGWRCPTPPAVAAAPLDIVFGVDLATGEVRWGEPRSDGALVRFPEANRLPGSGEEMLGLSAVRPTAPAAAGGPGPTAAGVSLSRVFGGDVAAWVAWLGDRGVDPRVLADLAVVLDLRDRTDITSLVEPPEDG